MPGEDVGAHHRRRPAAGGAAPAGRRERQRRGAGLPQRRGAGDGHQPVVRSVAVQFRRVAGAMDGVDAGPAHAAAQPGDRRALRAWLDLQDGGGDGGAGGARDHARRLGALPRLPRPGRRAVPLLAQGRPRLARSARRASRTVATCISTRSARRIGIDRIAAMAHRLGLGTELEIDLPGARPGFIPTREWRIGHGHAWNLGDTVVAGIGQGYIQVTPLQLATYAARVATGRKVEPHLTRKLGGVLQPGVAADRLAQPRHARALPACRARGHVGGGERARRHRAGSEAARPALADGGQDRFVAGAPGVARAARAGQLRQLEAALGVPPARAVRRLCAV